MDKSKYWQRIKGNGNHNLYRRRGSPYIYVSVWRDGKIHRFNTKKEQVIEAREVRNIQIGKFDLGDDEALKSKKVPFSELADDYIRDCERREKSDSDELRSLRRICISVNHLRGFLGGKQAKSIKRLSIVDYIAYRQDQTTHYGKSPEISTINRELQELQSILKMGVENEKLSKMPVFPKKTSEKNRKRKIYIKEEEYASLMAVLRDFEMEEKTKKGYTRKRIVRLKFLSRLIPFYYITGMRNKEGVDLAWKPDVPDSSGYVDMEKGVIHLTRTKNKERRIIPLDEETREILEAQRKELRKMFKRDFDWVFFRKVNGRFERILDFRRTWKRALSEAGIPEDRRIHDFRRSAKRNHRLAGTHQIVSKAILGHMSDEVHEDYDTVEIEERREAMQNVARHRKTIAIAQSEE